MSSRTSTYSVASRISTEVERRVGKLPLLGRYHKLPRTLEQDFTVSEKKVLGKGLNGSVITAVRKGSQNPEEKFAVKRFDLSKMKSKALASLEKEVQIYLCMDHPHIARLVNVYETAECLTLVMECMYGGELFDRITSAKRFPEAQAADVTRQMLLAVHYLHSHGAVHRDLKLENFLYDEKGGNLLKLIDFGFSKFRDHDARMKTACGTLSYVAPEVLTEKYTSQCDLWSLGVIVFILLSGSMPFSSDDDAQTKAKIISCRYNMKPERWNKVSPLGSEFVRSLLEKRPEVRLTAKQALEHRWIQQYAEQAAPTTINPSLMDALQHYSAAPKFRRCCLVSMARLLSNQETAEVRREFCAIDTDQQGTISLGELKSLMVNKFHASEDDVLSIFQAMDANHDDEIHYSEFLAAMLPTRMSLNDNLLDTTFRHFDTDLSGYITADNLRDAFGSTFEGESVEQLIGEADPTGSGQISYTDFAAYVRGTPITCQTVQISYPPGGSPLNQHAKKLSSSNVELDTHPDPKKRSLAKEEHAELRRRIAEERATQQVCCNIM